MKKLLPLLLLALTLMTAVEAFAQASSTVLVRDDAKLGKFLTDSSGMTLYIFKKDTSSESTCYDTCAKNWPAFLASGDLTLPSGVAGKLDITTRKDGAKQVTYNGAPLYHFAKDTAPGDTKGQGIGNVWFVATAQLATTAVPTTGGTLLPDSAVTLTLLVASLALLGTGLWLRRSHSA